MREPESKNSRVTHVLETQLITPFQNADLPLGPDCIKYLSKTPKAPHDIDNWMIDIPESNSTGLFLAVRGPELAKREVQQNHTVPSPSMSIAEDRALNWWNVAFWVMVLWTISGIACAVLPFLRRMTAKYTDDSNHIDGLLLEPWIITRFARKLFIFGIWLLFWVSWAVILIHLYKQQRWTAASEFLATCKMQQASPTSA